MKLISFYLQQFEDPCERKNKPEGGEMKKTGSQVLDAICISEAEKQAVLTLIREEVRTVNSSNFKYVVSLLVFPEWIF